ncbi:hypothetical protein HA50_27340 [Pantoea cypripedii]|uniref:Uncharacterized protein n=1 Tax=Pantoea cypripedii TaxID=55209 RepID=A0A1X1EMX6_PANCY|nr:hypothetical protein HA50_27340 [Pantoea cypripedii]
MQGRLQSRSAANGGRELDGETAKNERANNGKITDGEQRERVQKSALAALVSLAAGLKLRHGDCRRGTGG